MASSDRWSIKCITIFLLVAFIQGSAFAQGTWYNFDSSVYVIAFDEQIYSRSLTITINRKGDVSAAGSVQITTTNINSAYFDGSDLMIDETVLFEADETLQTLSIDYIFNENINEDYLLASLSNPGAGESLGELTNAVVIRPAVTTFSFDRPVYFVNEDGSYTNIYADDIMIVPSNWYYVEQYNNHDIELRVEAFSADEGDDFVVHTGFINNPFSYGYIDLQIIDDSVLEGLDFFMITLQGLHHDFTDHAIVIIRDNDTPISWYSFDNADYCVNEENTSVTLTINRSGDVSVPGNVDISTSSLSATADLDYGQVINETVSFAIGDTSKTFTINIINDNNIEDVELFYVELINPEQADLGDISTATVFVMDDDPSSATISAAASVHTIPESVGQFQISFLRSGDLKSSVDIDVTVIPGSAQLTQDFTYTPPTVIRFLPGQSVAEYEFTIVDDSIAESLEDLIVAIDIGSLPMSVVVGNSGQARVYILDNDGDADLDNGTIMGLTSTPLASAALGISLLILVVMVFTIIVVCKSRKNSGSEYETPRKVEVMNGGESNDNASHYTDPDDASRQGPHSVSSSHPMQQLTVSEQNEEEYAYANVN